MSFLSIAPYAAEKINHHSAELLFLRALCAGDTENAAAFFSGYSAIWKALRH